MASPYVSLRSSGATGHAPDPPGSPGSEAFLGYRFSAETPRALLARKAISCMQKKPFQPPTYAPLSPSKRHAEHAERDAEHPADESRCREKRGRMSLAVYSSLMKVYSHAKLFHKACDMYEDLKEDGVKLEREGDGDGGWGWWGGICQGTWRTL